MKRKQKSTLAIALVSITAGLASGCGGDPVSVVDVPADQIKDVQPAPPPPVVARGKKIGPKGGMSAVLAPGTPGASSPKAR